MSYENPAAYFSAADAMAARGSRRRNTAGSLADFISKRQQRIGALKASRKQNREQKASGFWQEYQNSIADLDKMKSSLTRGMSGKKNEARELEILAFNNQITAQLAKIGKELSAKLGGPEGDDMTEQEIQQLIGSSLGRVKKLHETITHFTAAADEYYNAPKDGRSNAILSSSNPELQMLFDKLQDDEINLVINEDESGDFNFIPLSKSVGIKNTDYVDFDNDGQISPEEKLEAVQQFMSDPANDVYKIDPNGEISYNHVETIGPINASGIAANFKKGDKATYFNTIGDLKTLHKDFDQAFNAWWQTHGNSIQQISPSDDGKTVVPSDFRPRDETVKGSMASVKPSDQRFNNLAQVEALLASPAGEELFQAFLGSPTLESDLAGWLQEDIDLEGKTLQEMQDMLQLQLTDRVLNYNLGRPLEESVDNTKVAQTATPIQQ